MSDEVALGLVIPAVFLVCGLALLAAALRSLARTRAFLAAAREATGEVVALEEEPPSEAGDSRTYRPVVAFSTDGGQRVEFRAVAHGNPPAYPRGASVSVLYDPARPAEARIRSFAELWAAALLLGALGLVFSALGAALLLGLIPL